MGDRFGGPCVSSFGASVRSGVSFASAEVQSAETEALLDAGVEIAAAHVIDEDKQRQWRPDGKLHTISFAGKKLLITIGDPNGLIDLNKADKSLILGLLKRHASSKRKRSRSETVFCSRGASQKM